MSLKIAAEHLKSKGRGPDTELVHMTKGEIKGLRQLAKLHGGDLTINPETGLPEAGFLEKILPVVAMAAATYFTAGAATPAFATALEGTALASSSGLLAGAASGALIGGIGAGLQGGDIGKGALFGGIGGGITAGLGGYDAAPNVFSSMGDTSNALVTTGPQAVDLAAKNAVPLADANQAVTEAGKNAASMAPGEARNVALNKLAEQTGTGITSSAFGSAPGINAEQAMYQAENLASPGRLDIATGQPLPAGNIYPTLTPTPSTPTSYYSGLGTGMMDTAKKGAILGAPGFLAQNYGMTPGGTGQVPTGKYTSTLERISPNFRAQEPVRPNPYYTGQYTDYRVPRAATGGLMNDAFGPQDGQTNYAGGGAIAFANRGIVEPLPRSSGADVGTYSDTDPNTANLDAYNAALYRFNKVNKKAGIKAPVQFKQAQALGDIEEAADGGIMHGIGGYSDGGRMLKGPGDGMSDSIPAVIGKKQPARLADGEFVVPADVVSHLGNGSTDAGAKRLYSMMDKVRHARTGKKKQAPEVKYKQGVPV
jgi:hypothetical protein